MNDNNITFDDKDFVINLDDLLATIHSILEEDEDVEDFEEDVEDSVEDEKVVEKMKENKEDNDVYLKKIEALTNQLYEKNHIIEMLDNYLDKAYEKIATLMKTKYYDEPISEHIKEIRFNGPATIIFWTDNTKTITVCKDEHYDIEKGVVVAILKKLIGNNYNEILNSLPVPDKDEMYDTNKQIILDLLNTKKLTDAQKEAVKYFMS